MLDVDRSATASLNELETVLESLFNDAVTTPVRSVPGVYFGHDPILGQLFVTGEDHSALRLAICRALVADAKFRQEVPGWPALPLRPEDIEAMENAACPRCNVVGFFGASLRDANWCLGHPSFTPFVSGLMFDRNTPIEIRANSELLQQFPPRPLAGLCDGKLRWRSPETIAWDRDYEIKCAAYEAREAAGFVD